MRQNPWLLLSFALGCSSSQALLSPPDSIGSCENAGNQATDALAGNQSCNYDSDCVLLATPSCVDLSAGSQVPGEAAVANSSLASVEHAFSVIKAETCSSCTGDDDGENVSFEEGVVAVAQCQQGGCVVSTGPALSQGEGNFEWDCDAGCSSDQYCEVDYPATSWATCPGLPGYATVIGPGQCVSATPSAPNAPCFADAYCGFQENCQAAGGVPCTNLDAICTCATTCGAYQPTSCQPQCVLISDNHGCNVCACDSDAGCPPLPPDAG